MSEVIELQVSDEFHGKRLDAVLGALVENHSRSALKSMIDEGRILVDGAVQTKPSFKVNAGSMVTVNLPEPESLEAVPEDLPLDIVYQDADVMVINKPINFVVHPGAGVKNGTVMNAMLYHFPQTATLARVDRAPLR